MKHSGNILFYFQTINLKNANLCLHVRSYLSSLCRVDLAVLRVHRTREHVDHPHFLKVKLRNIEENLFFKVTLPARPHCQIQFLNLSDTLLFYPVLYNVTHSIIYNRTVLMGTILKKVLFFNDCHSCHEYDR